MVWSLSFILTFLLSKYFFVSFLIKEVIFKFLLLYKVNLVSIPLLSLFEIKTISVYRELKAAIYQSPGFYRFTKKVLVLEFLFVSIGSVSHTFGTIFSSGTLIKSFKVLQKT
jgi:hypothetical protein